MKERKEIQGKVPSLEFRSTRIVEPHMVDNYGDHLNNAAAIKILEEERASLLAAREVPLEDIGRDFGVWGFVRKIEAVYNKQANLGDELDAITRVYPRNASIFFHHLLNDKSSNVLDALVTISIVDSVGKPTRIPRGLIEKLSRE